MGLSLKDIILTSGRVNGKTSKTEYHGRIDGILDGRVNSP